MTGSRITTNGHVQFLDYHWAPIALVAIASGYFSTRAAQGGTIDFDDLDTHDVVTTQYADALFSTVDGFQITVRTRDLGTSLPNFICTDPIGQPGSGGSVGCRNNIFVDFPDAVSGLTFQAVGDCDQGRVATVDVYSIGVLAGSVHILADGDPFSPEFVDISSFSNVTRIEIHSVTDSQGLGFDDFSFIPEPPSKFVLSIALLGAAAMCNHMSRQVLE